MIILIFFKNVILGALQTYPRRLRRAVLDRRVRGEQLGLRGPRRRRTNCLIISRNFQRSLYKVTAEYVYWKLTTQEIWLGESRAIGGNGRTPRSTTSQLELIA